MKTEDEQHKKTKARKDTKQKNKENNARTRWLITIFVLAMVISGSFSFLSQEVLNTASLLGAFAVLLGIIAVGIVFDVLGVAVTAADERPFHSMAARKVPGAAEAIQLLRNASKVSTICNDVVGDICGIISGTAAAVVALEAALKIQPVPLTVLQLVLSALVAGLTIGGKACCKSIAIEKSTGIVYSAAKVIHFFKHLFRKKHK